MYKIDAENIEKLVKITNLLNNLEIKGMNNVFLLNNIMVSIQQILSGIETLNKPEREV